MSVNKYCVHIPISAITLEHFTPSSVHYFTDHAKGGIKCHIPGTCRNSPAT